MINEAAFQKVFGGQEILTVHRKPSLGGKQKMEVRTPQGVLVYWNTGQWTHQRTYDGYKLAMTPRSWYAD